MSLGNPSVMVNCLLKYEHTKSTTDGHPFAALHVKGVSDLI